MHPTAPIPASYWLLEGRLLAGEYPGAYDRTRARAKLELLIAAGIRSFIDLTDPADTLAPYSELLAELAAEHGIDCRYTRFAVCDLGTPTRQLMSEILAVLRTELAEGRPVYVHCWGGIGRTGTVAGCWLVEQGLTADDALERIVTLRRGTPDASRRSPETDEQCGFVRAWNESRRTE